MPDPAFQVEMTNFSAARQGAAWIYPRIWEEERFQRYHDHYLNELFNQPIRASNSLIALRDPSDDKVHIEDIIRLNWFRVITDFYSQGYFGDRPLVGST